MARASHRRILVGLVLLSLGLLVATASCSNAPEGGGVHVLSADGAVGPVMANYLDRGIEQAEEGEAAAVVIELDTPGGLDSAMRDIVKDITNADVPVVVYVAPSGARAASAGTFIVMAAHIAAMAPGTALGAAHPVDVSGGDVEGDLGEKIENDAAALIRSLAEQHGRNADWAERAVRESVSISANEAVDLNVAELVVPSTEQLVDAIDGRSVELHDGREVRLATAGQPIRENDMTAFEDFLALLSDPNIAFLLLTLGSLALVVELFHPTIFGGVAGALALILAFFSLGTLPVNWAGVALIALAFALFVLELFVTSYGILGVGGAVAMALGGLLLTTSDQREFEVSVWLAFGLPAVIGALFAAFVLYVFSSRSRPVAIGTEALIGQTAVATSPLAPSGYVLLHGERWRAIAPRTVAEGEAVRVTGLRGLELTVEPTDAAPRAASPE
ncbi:MAG TPA: nodulation protein NfeD [Dehalococcoidia bacterium]|nr:nodulation protein NfeD [Dehalococcoidia bacterium]